MAAKLDLPGDFQPGKTYLLKGETLVAWRKALVADRVVAGPRIRETGTPGGRIWEVDFKDTMPGFHPFRIKKVSEGIWELLLTPALVAERMAATGTPPLLWHVPKIGGTPITNDPPPVLTIGPGEYAMLRLKTEKTGEHTGADLEIFSGPFADGTFHVPPGVGPDAPTGQDGEYIFKLFRFDVSAGKPIIVPFQLDTIEWMPFAWTGDVIGAGNGQIYKGYNAARSLHEFRAIEAMFPGFGAMESPVTTATEVQLRGNGFWGNVRFEECASDGEGSPTLKGILAIRDGYASMHASEETVPGSPDDIEPTNTTFTYANCHCCGEGP